MNRRVRSRLVVMSIAVVLLQAPTLPAQVRREIRIPDIMGYKTLKCDFHMHTVFSDGLVWPTVRVDEAWREGLDAISITDHIEYQPHKADVPINHNRSYELALPRARERGILLVKGTEITRDTPPGHFNALFVEDVEPMDTEDLLDCMAAADKQGAFILWNHPGWKPDKKGWFDIHTTIYEKKYLRGIEVVNGSSYYPEAHAWALEKNLTFFGNSDIHASATLEETTPENHRPMTLVFAADKSIRAIKDAIVAGRTAVWYEDKVIGRERYVDALFEAAVRICDIERQQKVVYFTMRNDSDLSIQLQQVGKVGPKEINLPANTATRIRLGVSGTEKPVELSYLAKNFLVGPDKGLPVNLIIAGQLTIEVEAEIMNK